MYKRLNFQIQMQNYRIQLTAEDEHTSPYVVLVHHTIHHLEISTLCIIEVCEFQDN